MYNYIMFHQQTRWLVTCYSAFSRKVSVLWKIKQIASLYPLKKSIFICLGSSCRRTWSLGTSVDCEYPFCYREWVNSPFFQRGNWCLFQQAAFFVFSFVASSPLRRLQQMATRTSDLLQSVQVAHKFDEGALLRYARLHVPGFPPAPANLTVSQASFLFFPVIICLISILMWQSIFWVFCCEHFTNSVGNWKMARTRIWLGIRFFSVKFPVYGQQLRFSWWIQ